ISIRGIAVNQPVLLHLGSSLYVCVSGDELRVEEKIRSFDGCQFSIQPLNSGTKLTIPILPIITAAPTQSPTSSPTQSPSVSPTQSPTSFADTLVGSRPNIVFVMFDDLGYHDVGFTPFGPRPKILEATPFMTM